MRDKVALFEPLPTRAASSFYSSCSTRLHAARSCMSYPHNRTKSCILPIGGPVIHVEAVPGGHAATRPCLARNAH